MAGLRNLRIADSARYWLNTAEIDVNNMSGWAVRISKPPLSWLANESDGRLATLLVAEDYSRLSDLVPRGAWEKVGGEARQLLIATLIDRSGGLQNGTLARPVLSHNRRDWEIERNAVSPPSANIMDF